jgi:hypothetical protein
MSEQKKSSFVGKLMKFVLLSIVGLVAFAVLLAVTLPLWVNPVVTGIAGKVVPNYTGTDFRINRFYLNPYSGILGIEGVKLSNPYGFGESAAFSLEKFNVEVLVGSVFSDTILVKDIVIEDAFVSYFSSKGKNNFDVILENVQSAMEPKNEKDDVKEAKDETTTSQKKVIIEHLRVAGTKVKLIKSDVMPALLLPTIELTDIGKKSNGATFEEAWNQISASVMKAMSSIGDGFGALGGLLEDSTKNFTKTLDNVSVKTGNAMTGALNATKEVSTSASDAVKKTTDAVSGAAKGTVDAVGGAAKGTVDAINDTATKTTEGVKNLLKGLGK